jgi:hypothetical protein
LVDNIMLTSLCEAFGLLLVHHLVYLCKHRQASD